MFTKILIANRGEIACRVIQTAKKMGIRTVAVYSDADQFSQHVAQADEAVALGGLGAKESYLVMDKIIAAAKQTGAEAIHPGYGFLSENEQFAQLCADNNIVFIGPTPEAIQLMGLKAESKALMEKAAVPLTPGYHGQRQDADFLQAEADRIGYPVLIKASAGGGGKGMSLVERSSDFQTALETCKREARSSFGNDHVLIEKYIVQPRHVEVQVFGDQHGNYVHLFERDCSVQRRHQKVLEEAPAPNLPEHYLVKMREAAINAARAVNYVGAGTVEFIAQQSGEFYFMEMNTRLQVEHPVTEMITGLDLVEWQLRVAAGEPLPLKQADIHAHGHAFEARIYAEDPDKGFLPATGRILNMALPTQNNHVRIDSGVVVGDEISLHYDPMIAKLIVKGATREEALNRLSYALQQFQVVGLKNNIAFLNRLVNAPSFRNVTLDTGLIEKEHDYLFATAPTADISILAAATLYAFQHSFQTAKTTFAVQPWQLTDGWKNNGRFSRTYNFLLQGEPVSTTLHQHTDNLFELNWQNQTQTITAVRQHHHEWVAKIGEHTRHFNIMAENKHNFTVFSDGLPFSFTLIDPFAALDQEERNEGSLNAPMPGSVVKVLVEAGQKVKQGDALLILEAMKMEHTIEAPRDGVVAEICYNIGDLVAEGDQLAILE